MLELNHPIEKIVKTITYKGVRFQIVERPDVIWVGCVAYADNNTDPPFPDDDLTLLRRYDSLVYDFPMQNRMNPDWSAAISINYRCNDKPSGIMFAQETYSKNQDERYELFTQPGGLWLRVLNDTNAVVLLGKESAAPYEYFAESQILQTVAKENGYVENPNINVQVEYSCHAEYNTPPHRNYAYIPIIRL